MTTNQLTYMQLLEQMRANRANEDLKSRQLDISEMTAAPTAEKLRTEVEAINAKLPVELRLTEEQITRTANDAEKILTEDIAARMKAGDVIGAAQLTQQRAVDAERKGYEWSELSGSEKAAAVTNSVFTALSGLWNSFVGGTKDAVGTIVKIFGG